MKRDQALLRVAQDLAIDGILADALQHDLANVDLIAGKIAPLCATLDRACRDDLLEQLSPLPCLRAIWGISYRLAEAPLRGSNGEELLRVVKMLLLRYGARTSRHCHQERIEVHVPLHGIIPEWAGAALAFPILGRRLGVVLPPLTTHAFLGIGEPFGAIVSYDIRPFDRACDRKYVVDPPIAEGAAPRLLVSTHTLSEKKGRQLL